MKNTTFRGGYTIRDQYAAHFLTFTVCGWIDLLTRKVYKDILIDSFKFCQLNKRLVLNAFVVMSNHIHLIARATNEKYTLSDIVRDFKKYTHNTMMPIIDSEVESRRLWMLHQFKYYGNRNSKNEDYQIWTNNNHPEECFSKEFTDVKVNYIHQNPVRSGIVAFPEHYIYSSAANYVGGKGIIDIEMLD